MTECYDKYLRDVRVFVRFAGERMVDKELVMARKKKLVEQGDAVPSVNSMRASVNGLLDFLGWQECKVKNIRLQHQTYCTEDKEQTICATDIRVPELKCFTVEMVRRSEIAVDCKSKTRTILVPGQLKAILLKFAPKWGIRTGVIFRGRSGKALDRGCIWRQMKKLCVAAGVLPSKMFPHNLRKLFARTFFGIEKDIAKLAGILGHSGITKTRIYIMKTGTEHRRKIERLGLVV